MEMVKTEAIAKTITAKEKTEETIMEEKVKKATVEVAEVVEATEIEQAMEMPKAMVMK